MVYLAIVGALIFIIGIIVAMCKLYKEGLLTALIGGIIFVLAGIISGLTTVNTGHVGVISLFGHVYKDTINPGIHIINPFCSVTEVSVMTENYIMSAMHDEGQKQGDDSVSALTSDGLRIIADISVPYKLNDDDVVWVYKNFGINYVDKLLRPAARTAARRAMSKYTGQECYSNKRDQIAGEIKTCFDEEIEGIIRQYTNGPIKPIIVSQVLIGRVELPDKVKEAIEEKLKADQESQAMQFRLKRESQEAERKKIEAEGIQKFQEIVSKGIDENVLRWKGIEATVELAKSPNSKIIVVGGTDGLPLILGSDK